ARRAALARVRRPPRLPHPAYLLREPRALRGGDVLGRLRRLAPLRVHARAAVVPLAVPRGAVLHEDAHRLLARLVARDRREVLSPLAARGLRPAAQACARADRARARARA